jgi:hypothetical protein
MSKEHIETLAVHFTQNPEEYAKIVEGVKSKDEYIDRVLDAASAKGLIIERADLLTWLKAQQTVDEKGELSEAQLDAVVGGAGVIYGQGMSSSSHISTPKKYNPFGIKDYSLDWGPL